jgi:glycosyltransferase involved in cell wall biosynthesis
MSTPPLSSTADVALLTGGGDRPYAYGLTTALAQAGVGVEVIAGNELDDPALHALSNVTFFNLRGDQSPGAPLATKARRILDYYARLLHYAATARPQVFHLLWNNKFEYLDRTVLMLYYRGLGKRVALTVHNVNTAARDGHDSWLNRLTLRCQYRLSSHIFVHTERMKHELCSSFGIPESRVSIIPFGINNSVPVTAMTRSEARARLGLNESAKTILFFGTIAPYKGLEYLVSAFRHIISTEPSARLIIAGRPRRGDEGYWQGIATALADPVLAGAVIQRISYIPDGETELYFKAADLTVLPYLQIFQSGVLFLAYSFGVPVIVSDVGSLREDVREGETGFICPAGDSAGLASTLEKYFASDLFQGLAARQSTIRDWAQERHSWETVAQLTVKQYERMRGTTPAARAATGELQ